MEAADMTDTIRVIVRLDDIGNAANVGGPVITTFRTFEVSAPELVDYMRAHVGRGSYMTKTIVGVEIPEEPRP
jgi:hypothetical protein